MKAILLKDFGGPEMMEWGDADMPVPGENQILIRVAATRNTARRLAALYA